MAALPQIPGYRVVRLISEGKRSRMYLAEQESLARQVALKVLSDEFYKDPQFKKRFIDGGKSGAQLNHANILAVFDIGSVSGFPYIATEYLPGGTLRDRLDKGMSTDDALTVAKELAAALEFSHRHGINHRDLKPSNVLFRSSGSAVLADPGILNATEQGARMSVGSPHYMSPEQLQNEPVDARSDLYALGLMLYEMLAGMLPFDADDPFQVALMQVNDPAPPLPDGLKKYQPLLDQLLAKDPAKRPASAQAVLDAIGELSETKPPATPKARPAKPKPPVADKSLALKPKPAAPVRTPAKPAPVAPLAQTALAPAVELPPMAATAMMPNPTMVVARDDLTAPSTSPAASAPPARKYKPKPRWPALLAILLLVTALIIGLFWFFGGSDVPAEGAGQAKPQASQLGGTDSMNSKENDDVAEWLQRGNDQFAKNLLVAPDDGNAARSYKKALSLDPNSEEALEGERNVVSRTDFLIRQLIGEGSFAAAREALDKAIAIYPDRVAFQVLDSTLAEQEN